MSTKVTVQTKNFEEALKLATFGHQVPFNHLSTVHEVRAVEDHVQLKELFGHYLTGLPTATAAFFGLLWHPKITSGEKRVHDYISRRWIAHLEEAAKYFPLHPATLTSLAQYGYMENELARFIVIRDHPLASQVQKVLAGAHLNETRRKLAARTDLSDEAARILVHDKTTNVRSELANKQTLPTGVADELAADVSAGVRLAISRGAHPLTRESWRILANDTDSRICKQVATVPGCPEDLRVVAALNGMRPENS